MKNKIFGMIVLCTFLAAGCGGRQASSPEPPLNTTEEAEKEPETQRVEEEPDTEETEETAQKEGTSYTWEEVTVTIPASWEGRYVLVEDTSGFYFYQKASYDKQEGMGYLWGIARSDEFYNYGAGETLLAYTKDGYFYYMEQPTDVGFDIDEAEDYNQMAKEFDAFTKSVSIDKPEVSYYTGEEILPQSSFMTVSEDTLLNLSVNELRLAKNEIYARHGRKFTNGYLQGYFNSCSWYQGTIAPEDFDEGTLSPLEQDNVKIITKAQESYRQEHPYPIEYQTSSVAKADLTGDGTINRISCQIKEVGDYQYEGTITIDGTSYSLNDFIHFDDPLMDVFYITDISELEDGLEIAVLDNGPSNDPVTYFFGYDGTLRYLGGMGGFPFPEQNYGINGFDSYGGIVGQGRVDIIETAYIEAFWYQDMETKEIVQQDYGRWCHYIPCLPHELYEDLTVHTQMDTSAPEVTIPKQEQVFFILTDGESWIQVKGKDGSKGYLKVSDGVLTETGKNAQDVFSDLNYFD